MRHFSSALVFSMLAFLGGCAGAKPDVARAPVSGNAHVSVAMDDATSRSLLGEEEDGPVGTTMLTSETIVLAPAAKNAAPSYVVPPEEQIGEDAPPPVRTWGTTAPDLDGIPAARE